MSQRSSSTDLQPLQAPDRAYLEDGAAIASESLDCETVIKLLNASLATELVCVLRYRRHHFMARGIHSHSVAQEFLVHSNEEQAHADLLAERIVQLGGEPDFAPEGLTSRSHVEYIAGTTLMSMIREDLIAEDIAINNYRGFIQLLGDNDPTTRRMLENILAVEEQHADELADLLLGFPMKAK